MKLLTGLFAGTGVSIASVTTLIGSAVGGAVFVSFLKHGHVVRGESERDVSPASS